MRPLFLLLCLTLSFSCFSRISEYSVTKKAYWRISGVRYCYQPVSMSILQVYDFFPVQLQHKDRIAGLRVGKRVLNDLGAAHCGHTELAIRGEIFDRRGERGKPTHSERSRGEMGCLRGEEHVGRHHIRRHFPRHGDIHSQLGDDTEFRWLEGDLLHSRDPAVDLVRCLLHVLRGLAGGAEVHLGRGEIAHCQLVRPPFARHRQNEGPLEKYFHIGANVGPDRHQYLGQLLLVLPAYPDAALYE